MTIIEIAGSRYQVRRNGNTREVMIDGNWIDSADFVDALMKRGSYDQVAELFKLGKTIFEGGVTQ